MLKTEKQKFEELPKIEDVVSSGAVDYKLFPKPTKEIVEYIQKISNRPIREDIILPAIINAFAFMVNSKRVTIDSFSEKNPFPNIYTIIFAPSGSGKDFPMNAILNDLLPLVIEELKQEYNKFESAYLEDPRGYLSMDREIELKKKEKETLLEQNPIKGFATTVDSGTSVGFREFTSTYETFGIGVPFFRVGEFSSYIGDTINSDRKEFMNDLFIAYHRGDISGKTTGNRKKALSAGDTPCCLFAGTSLSMVDGRGQKESLIRLLDGGFARRCTIAYIPKSMTMKRVNEEDYEALLKEEERRREGGKMISGLKSQLTMIYKSITKDSVVKMSQEAKLMYMKYRAYINNNAGNSLHPVEFSERNTRVENIACVLSVIRDPIDCEIGLKDILSAISYVEYYGAGFMLFLEEEMKSFAERVYEFIKENPAGVSIMDIRSKRYVGKNRFSTEFRNALPEIEELAMLDGKELTDTVETRTGKRPTTYYKLEDAGNNKKIKTAPIEHSLDSFKISKSNNMANDPWEAKGRTFSVVESSYQHLVDIIKETAIVPNPMKGGKKAENCVAGGVFMGIDIDDSMSLETAKEFFENNKIKSIIVTSASHQKEYKKLSNRDRESGVEPKKIEPKDKYHVFAFFNKPFTGSPHEWIEMYKGVAEDIGAEMIDKQCANMNRMFFKSPEDATVYHVDGDGIDWEAYLNKEPKKADVSIIKGKKPLIVRTDGKRMSDEDNRSVEQRVDDYVIKVLGVEKIYEGKSIVGKDGNSVSGRNSALNNIWVYNKEKNNASFADECCRYANRKYCVPNYTDIEMDVFLKNKK